ncbi:MAG: orotate phosphoribosyltransferase [Verrucomicrobia bacterium]|nr:orotate phosphoribosyltransferase [Verrucomicrobiota bacterium]
MTSQQEEVLQIFKETGALLEGHFILRSGLRSAHFFQCARVCEHLDRVTRLAEMLIAALPNKDFKTVVAPAMGGLVFGQEVARQLGKRFIFVEKVEDRLALRRNFKIADGEKVLVVEDVITKGGRVQETLDIIDSRGGIAVGIAVMVDRSAGTAKFPAPLTSLLQLNFPTYAADALPPELRNIPAVKPGS